MANGWRTRTAEELDATIETWYEAFTFYKIPADPDVYQELYLRAFGIRADAQHQGKDVPQCDAVLLASCWPGLKTDMEARRVAAGRTLTENAASVCKHCLGSGWRQVTQGNHKGVKKCDHQDFQPEMI